MISTLITWILSPIFLYISLVAMKDLMAYIKYLVYYKSQGIKFEYIPVLGLLGFFVTKKGQNDVGEIQRHLANKKYKNEKIIAVNNFQTSQVNLILKDPALIGKFFLKETDFTIRKNLKKDLFKQGFIMKGGKKALDERSTFNDFFKPSNLAHFTPCIRKIVDTEMEKLRSQYLRREDQSDEFMRINLREFFPGVFSKIINELMFGNDFPVLDGKTVPEMVSEAVEFGYKNVLRNPFNLLSLDYLSKFNLLSASKISLEKSKKVENIIERIIRQREKAPRKDRTVNLIDLMVNHNETSPESKKWNIDQMIGNVVMFQSAGMDTSKNTTEGLIDYLSKDLNKQRKLVEEILPNLYSSEEDKGKFETYEDSEFLSGIVAEGLRKFGPALISFPKRLVKDMEIGGYKLKKGSNVIIPILMVHYSEENFENPDKFDEGRFMEGRKVKRNTYMPFSLGKRACPGKYLADVMIKINIVSFFENFELREREENETEFIVRFSYGVKDCFVDLRPRGN